MKSLSVAVFAALFWSTTLLAQFDVGVVLPFENNARDPKLDWISESFVEVLSSKVASPRFMMLDRRDRAAAFDSLGIPSNASILSEATIYKVAQALDANKVILGSYDYSNGVFTAVAQILEMAGPSLSEKFTESGPLASLLEIQTGLAWQVQKSLRPSFSISKSEYIREHQGPRLEAFENYLRGLISKSRVQQIRYFREALRLAPTFTTPAFELGMIYFRDRDYPTSILWLSKLRRGDPDYLEANYFLGLAYLYREQYERSAAAFRVVEQQLPLNEVYNDLGIALMRQDRPGAAQYFEKAVQSAPSDPDYQFNLGYAYWKRGSFGQALPHLRKALQRASHPAWRAIYIQCLQKTGQLEESARQTRLLQQQAPDWNPNPEARLLEKLERPKDHYDGASFRQLRMLMQIQAELKHSKLALDDHASLHYQRAEQFLKDGSDRDAIEELQQVIDYNPEETGAYRELARIYIRAKRFEEAGKALSQSLQREKTAEDYLLLAKVYMEQGKLEEARVQLNAALGLEPSSPAAETVRQELNAKSIPRP